ncbi:hypothetical protein PC129_g7733 [Phytophthora cactorum]|nr:hypothetical protein PC129_g7733 [Phytophthora cactorum]
MFLIPLYAIIFGTTFYQLSAASVAKINSHIGFIYNNMDFIGVVNLMTVLEVTLSLWFTDYLIIVIILFVTIEY